MNAVTRRRVYAAVIVAGIVGVSISGCSSGSPAPTATVTMIQHDPGNTVTVTAGPTVTVTVSVTPTTNAQGLATQISSSGVYVVGTDIASGTWHTDGDGGQTGNLCYYATLNSTNTSNIINNNNFDGDETVDLSGAYAFEISGPCTWTHE